MPVRPVLVLALLAATPALHAQSAGDTAAIRATALDYVEGWYAGDADRMARALHPELVKRILVSDTATGRSAGRGTSRCSTSSATRLSRRP